jgi:ATP-binding cassette, subfamily F, member 3
MRAEQMLLQQAAMAKQQDKIAHLQSFINRFKAKASKAKQAQSRVKALDRMEKIAPVLADAEFTSNSRNRRICPTRCCRWSIRHSAIRRRKMRPAGTPPTVIVRGINRSVMPVSASASSAPTARANRRWSRPSPATCRRSAASHEGKGLNIGYFAQQELDVLRPQDTPLEHMIRLAKDAIANGGAMCRAREQELRNFLGTFNFGGDMVKQAVGTMSGGEKARLVLCMIVWQRPNLLLLDEPTNHLDLNTRERWRWRSTSSKAR